MQPQMQQGYAQSPMQQGLQQGYAQPMQHFA